VAASPENGLSPLRTRGGLLAAALLLALCSTATADRVYEQNKRANRLYDQGKYEEALKLYDDALVESPDEHKLRINKGSAQYQLEQYRDAIESYGGALTLKDKMALADLHYNRGNAYFQQGAQLASQGNQAAMQSFQAALQDYIRTLDVRPGDIDAKWNLQLTQRMIEELKKNPPEKQQNKDQQNNEQDQNQQSQQQDSGQDQQQKQDSRQQKEDQQQEQEKQQQAGQDRKEQDRAEPPQPQPGEPKEDMDKQEAARLIQQFADDADELNKPRKLGIAQGARPEKDW
jgi:Ca-activated chloride channel family protein